MELIFETKLPVNLSVGRISVDRTNLMDTGFYSHGYCYVLKPNGLLGEDLITRTLDRARLYTALSKSNDDLDISPSFDSPELSKIFKLTHALEHISFWELVRLSPPVLFAIKLGQVKVGAQTVYDRNSPLGPEFPIEFSFKRGVVLNQEVEMQAVRNACMRLTESSK